MPPVTREPTPPGPIAELFERLDQLRLAEGQPSLREIARRAGQGQVSSSTVHNAFKKARVPSWDNLEKIVRALHGNTHVFLELWKAAQQAENAPDGPAGRAAGPAAPGPREAKPGTAGTAQRIWSNEFPGRNDNFTGRAAELQMLGANLASDGSKAPAIQVISGMGGIGKTEIATEFIHSHIDQYEIIWWIRAEHHDRVREALVELGQRLDLRLTVANSGRERAITAVLDALGSGPCASWLLVFDNAEPSDLQRYMPACRPHGHIIVTSRLQSWPGYQDMDSVQVSPFTAQEAVDFLRGRVAGLASDKGLSDDEDAQRRTGAERLAEALGYLPIAIEHAGAYLAETGQAVDDYLNRYEENPHLLLSEQPTEFPAQVSATWAMSTELLTADAQHLFNLCAFFSPEPIAAELFLQNAGALDDSIGLREFLTSSPQFHAAASQLHRLSLAKNDGARDQIQMHRVVQAVTRGQLRRTRPDLFQAYRAAVETLLAESNPRHPDRGNRGIKDKRYDLSLQHLESDRSFLSSTNPALQRLIIDQVRRLHLRGSHVEAKQFGQEALKEWRERLRPPDDLPVLTLAVEVAIALRLDGHAADARQLTRETLSRLRREYPGHEVTLLCENNYGAELRARSLFQEALEQDSSLLPEFVRVFGPDNERTLNVRNNLAEDYRRRGRFQEALDTDEATYDARRRTLGPDNLRTLFSWDAMARDLRGLGRYQESLDIARRVVAEFAAASERENPDWLNARAGFAVALRKAGYNWDSLRESEDVVQRYRDYLGPDHPDAMRAAVNLINDRRAVGNLAGAGDLGREILDRCGERGFPYDIGYAAQVSLASVLRADGRPEEARRYDKQAWEGLIETYGDSHPFTLAAGVNYAADLAACHELASAISIGRDLLAKCQASLRQAHPDTSMAQSNLAIDLAASGNQEEADRRAGDALRHYAAALTAEHPLARAAAQRIRITAEIDLSPD